MIPAPPAIGINLDGVPHVFSAEDATWVLERNNPKLLQSHLTRRCKTRCGESCTTNGNRLNKRMWCSFSLSEKEREMPTGLVSMTPEKDDWVLLFPKDHYKGGKYCVDPEMMREMDGLIMDPDTSRDALTERERHMAACVFRVPKGETSGATHGTCHV
jgi:hypothetical protein